MFYIFAILLGLHGWSNLPVRAVGPVTFHMGHADPPHKLPVHRGGVQ